MHSLLYFISWNIFSTSTLILKYKYLHAAPAYNEISFFKSRHISIVHWSQWAEKLIENVITFRLSLLFLIYNKKLTDVLSFLLNSLSQCHCLITKNTARKIKCSLRISSVNVTKSAWNCGFGHVYCRNAEWKTSFFVQQNLLCISSPTLFFIVWYYIFAINLI